MCISLYEPIFLLNIFRNFSTEGPSTSLEVQNILEEKEILEKTLQRTKGTSFLHYFQ